MRLNFHLQIQHNSSPDKARTFLDPRFRQRHLYDELRRHAIHASQGYPTKYTRKPSTVFVREAEYTDACESRSNIFREPLPDKDCSKDGPEELYALLL